MDRFVIMGVAGCGKTSVGEGVADLTNVTFIDGDDLHPQANIDKMSAGIALSDADREPWLKDVGRHLGSDQGPLAIGCSALKRAYRDWIREKAGGPVGFIHLSAPKEVIAERMSRREGHFMPTSLLDSQFADLEQLQTDEDGWVVDIDASLEDVIRQTALCIKGVR